MTKSPKTSSVPGQALGYSLQFTKMTELLARPGEANEVEFEGWDDLSLKTPEGHTTLCQTKSALESNPAADRAVALWKSMSNWARLVHQRRLTVDNLKLVYFVSNPVDPGAWAKGFHAAGDDAAADAMIALTRDALWGAAPNFPLKSSVAKALGPELERFFGSSQQVQRIVIRCFALEIVTDDIHADLAAKLQWVDPRRRADVLDHAYGWTKRKVDELLGAKRPAIIRSGDFNVEMVAYIRKFNERAILRTFAPAAGPNTEEAEQLRLRLFVRQLELISLDYSDQIQAISDYYRAAIDRTELGASGEVHESSFNDLDSKLTRTWKNISRQKEIQSKNVSDVERGELVYRECIQQQHLLENQQPPDHFVPGCYHLLADAIKVGWHPQYAALLMNNASISQPAKS